MSWHRSIDRCRAYEFSRQFCRRILFATANNLRILFRNLGTRWDDEGGAYTDESPYPTRCRDRQTTPESRRNLAVCIDSCARPMALLAPPAACATTTPPCDRPAIPPVGLNPLVISATLDRHRFVAPSSALAVQRRRGIPCESSIRRSPHTKRRGDSNLNLNRSYRSIVTGHNRIR